MFDGGEGGGWGWSVFYVPRYLFSIENSTCFSCTTLPAYFCLSSPAVGVRGPYLVMAACLMGGGGGDGNGRCFMYPDICFLLKIVSVSSLLLLLYQHAAIHSPLLSA